MEMDGPLRFRDLFAGAPSRRRLVATFLALLELVKQQAIHARQEEDGAEILLFPKAGKTSHLDDVP
jgi:chromatin segregation and condensation protein Rec8/ScpA/Scc1 (kleisin family)